MSGTPPSETGDLLYASGSDALSACLGAIGGDRSEVVVPAYTCDRVVRAVLDRGLSPVFVDVSPSDGVITADGVHSRLSKATRAVIATHIYGNSPDLPALRTLVDEFGATLIEDSALRIADNEMGPSAAHATFHSYGRGKGIAIGVGGRLDLHDSDLITTPLTQSPARSLRQYARAAAYSRPIWWSQSQVVGLVRRKPREGNAHLHGYAVAGERAAPAIAWMISRATRHDRVERETLHRRLIDGIYGSELVESDRLQRLTGQSAHGSTTGFAILARNRYRLWSTLRRRGIDASTAFSYSVGSETSNLEFAASEMIAGAILVLPNHRRVTPGDARTITDIVNSS